MTAEQAIKEFELRAAEDLVHNAVTGEFGPVTDNVAATILSNVRAAFRHAAGTSDLSKIDYLTYADALADWAVADAEEHGLTDASNRAARCRRFVRTVDQREYKQRPYVDVSPPTEWKFLGDLLADAYEEYDDDYSPTNLTRLAVALGPHGIRAPEDLPTSPELKELLQKELSVHPSTVRRLLRSYRCARELAIEAGIAPERVPDIDRGPAEHERGLRSLPDLDERLAAHGHPIGSTRLHMATIIRILAPQWHEAMLAFMKKHPGRSSSWRKSLIGASSRILAELVRTETGDLTTAHPTELLVRHVDTGEIVAEEVPGGDDWMKHVDRTAYDEEPTEADGPATLKMTLLEHLAHECRDASAQNSNLRPSGESDGMYWTRTVRRDVQLAGDVALFAAGKSALFKEGSKQHATLTVEANTFRKRMIADNKEMSMVGHKAKEKLLAAGTYPMMIFLGLPALRKRALLRREEYYAILFRDETRPDRMSVARAEQAYHSALMDYVLFAVFLADGLRLANYTNARLGAAERGAGKIVKTTPHGTKVESFTHIQPILQSDGKTLLNVRTGFFGDDHEAVKLKQAKLRDGNWRSRPHYLRPGLVDYELLADFLTDVRPKNLASQGLIPSRDAYNLEQDIAEWHFALFVSPLKSAIPYRAVTGAYSPGRISRRYGRILHWVLTEVLGRDMAPFESPKLREEYPRVIGPHGGRLQAGTHLHGVLNRPEQAMAFLNDVRDTVEGQYSVVEASMIHKTGWEAPDFFNDLFFRVWDDNEAIDWDKEDPLEGIPADQRPPGLEAVR